MTYYLFIQRKGERAKLVNKGSNVIIGRCWREYQQSLDGIAFIDYPTNFHRVGKYKTIIIYR